MDSNITRQSRKEQRINLQQFNYSHRRLNFTTLKPQVVDTKVLFYQHLLIQGFFDLKLCQTQEACKYPLSIMYFALARLTEELGGTFSPKAEKPNLNFYLNLLGIERCLFNLTSNLNEWMLCIHVYDINKTLKNLKDISGHIVNIAQVIGQPIEHIMYLAVEFYKQFPFFVDKDIAQVLGGLEQVRKKYLEQKPKLTIPSFIQDYLAKNYKEQIEPDISNDSSKRTKRKLEKRLNEGKQRISRKRKVKGVTGNE